MGKQNGKDSPLELVLPQKSKQVFREAALKAVELGHEIVYTEGGTIYKWSPPSDAPIAIGTVEAPKRVERGWKTSLK